MDHKVYKKEDTKIEWLHTFYTCRWSIFEGLNYTDQRISDLTDMGLNWIDRWDTYVEGEIKMDWAGRGLWNISHFRRSLSKIGPFMARANYSPI